MCRWLSAAAAGFGLSFVFAAQSLIVRMVAPYNSLQNKPKNSCNRLRVNTLTVLGSLASFPGYLVENKAHSLRGFARSAAPALRRRPILDGPPRASMQIPSK
jgi:hypothetical protein